MKLNVKYFIKQIKSQTMKSKLQNLDTVEFALNTPPFKYPPPLLRADLEMSFFYFFKIPPLR